MQPLRAVVLALVFGLATPATAQAARRIGTDGPTVILMDADGTPVGHFHRA